LVSTTVVLALGFSTFVVASFLPNLYFGLFSAVTLVVALATDLILLPALLGAGGQPKE
jgi:predicted RND superfamily exporter protein